MEGRYRQYGMALAAWLPFTVLWVLLIMSYGRTTLATAIMMSVVSTGSAGLLGIGVWQVCARRPWPLRVTAGFYLFHAALATLYSVTWLALGIAFEWLHSGKISWAEITRSGGWSLLMGIWLYGLIAGISYAVQIRRQLHEKETLAVRAQLDAIRARLNPHFLFNALHTLSALVKFRPAQAESAIERLGDMLRYALKEEGRALVEFSEEYEFTRQYLAFEQLRYEERLKVNLEIDAASFDFEVPPFSVQTLAENAVRHAISVRPEGGSIWIRSVARNGGLLISVRDDGPGEGAGDGESHQFGLRSLRERLRAAFDGRSEVRVEKGPDGFSASFEVPGR